MAEPSDIKSGIRVFGIAALSATALVSGILLRDQRANATRIPTFQSLMVSKDVQSIPEDDYFTEIAGILRDEFVDPIPDEMKLATGAIKGMVGSLNDPDSNFFDKDEMPVVLRQMQGQFEGIGAELGFSYPKTLASSSTPGIPSVVVKSIVSGGAADKAGLKVGATIENIDGHWVMNSAYIEHARSIFDKVTKKELPASEMDRIRKDIRDKLDGAITPIRAWKKLSIGAEGSSKVSFLQGNSETIVQLSKGKWKRMLAPNSEFVAFTPGFEKSFSPNNGKLLFDLRGQSVGDFPTMLAVLKKVGISGQFGKIVRDDSRKPVVVQIRGEANSGSKIRVLVNEGTAGTPEVFAKIVAKAGGIVEGKSAGNPVATQVTLLPDNSGYTLCQGRFVMEAGK